MPEHGPAPPWAAVRARRAPSGLMHHEAKKWRNACMRVFRFASGALHHASGTHHRRHAAQRGGVVLDASPCGSGNTKSAALGGQAYLPLPSTHDASSGGERHGATYRLSTSAAPMSKKRSARWSARAARRPSRSTSRQRSPRNSVARRPVKAAASRRAFCRGTALAAATRRWISSGRRECRVRVRGGARG